MGTTREFFKTIADYPHNFGAGTVEIREPSETGTGWAPWFHVREFKLLLEKEIVTKEDVVGGRKYIAQKVQTKTEAKISFKADVMSKENLRLFLDAASLSSQTQNSGTWTAESFDVVKPGCWQELGKKKITISAIVDDATPTPHNLVEGTDYEIDTDRGLILPIPGSLYIGATDDVFKITGTYAEFINYELKAGAVNAHKVELWFRSDLAVGQQWDVKCYGLLKGSGEWILTGDEFQSLNFEMDCLSHATYGDVGVQVIDMGTVTN